MSATSTAVSPKFPSPLARNACPPNSNISPSWMQTFFHYVHNWALVPLSNWYMRVNNIKSEPGIFVLPFGLILKSRERVHEAEGIAMNLARAMGVPAPRYLSFGCFPGDFPSMLMTRLPGTCLEDIDDNDVDWVGVTEDLTNILKRMRSFANPWGKAVCNASGGPVHGPLIPGSPMPICSSEAEFQQTIRYICNFAGRTGNDMKHVLMAEELFAMPEHAIVFTHGDLNKHNVFVGSDGRVSGIIDWESAAWMPDYWEASVLIFKNRWVKNFQEEVCKGAYETECKYHRSMFTVLSDSFSY